jgi:diguanylate cyclase (GGDEF)-like protein
MLQEAQLLTRTRGATPAFNCLLAIAASLPVFMFHWVYFAVLLGQPDIALSTRPPVLAALNVIVLMAIVIDTGMVAWLWPRRHRSDPLPRFMVAVALVQAVTYVAMGIVYGPLTSPINTAMISALVVGFALLGRRPTVTGFIVAIVLITANDWLVLGGVVPYAPAVVPATFLYGEPVAWWRHWQDATFFMAMVLGIFLIVLLFGRLDRQRRKLEELSRTDSLTRLSNRRHFMERLGVERRRRDRYRQAFSVVLCDADHFKRVNDTWGHHAGDAVLRHVGDVLRTGLRIPGDVAARLGGEEFALLLTECREGEARIVCERLRRQLAEHEFRVGSECFHVTMSMGVVECRGGTEVAALKLADLNLYRAKDEGRDRVVVSVQEDSP